ncbi:hypothetical protein Pint_09731 [Pistacia integerrima]|uniref:Uncharacterized protein n=1 Tax=Pistacia integerrima TaxID=434235 RepID=A0ACC0XHC1_9ROSI|nr:hypothetical protein Pint_09731 [Pistacia integerrima]
MDSSWRSGGHFGKTGSENISVSDFAEDDAKEGPPEIIPESHISSPSEIPIIAAARNGIIEIVKAIVKVYPQAIEQVNEQVENIFHIAARYRREEILDFFNILIIRRFSDLARADPPYSLCPQDTNYAADSPFEHNLDNLFRSFPSNTSIPKFFNTSVGNSSDTVYGLYMCLNYIQADDCKTCIEIASQDGERLCPNKTEAVVWEEVCQLRYSNENFFGRLDVRGNIPKFNVKNVSEPERYKSVVKKILSNLTKAAAFDPSTEMYATGNVSFTDTDTLYALVQCTRDLSAHDCNTCLETAIADISSCCYISRGARLLSRSCYLRYELYAFYEGDTEPAGTDENRATGKGNQRKIWMIIILSTVLVCLILLVALACAVYCIRTRKGSRKSKVAYRNGRLKLIFKFNPAIVVIRTEQISVTSILRGQMI